MTDVVDSDELLRRIQRARACAAQEERFWRARGERLGREDPGIPVRCGTPRSARWPTGVVLRVLDEILTPGKHATPG